MFEIGQLIVCIDSKNLPVEKWKDFSKLKEGSIYTVRDLNLKPDGSNKSAPPGSSFGVRLNEVRVMIGDIDVWFADARFKPVEEDPRFSKLITIKSKELVE
jgi:hypothetical protein